MADHVLQDTDSLHGVLQDSDSSSGPIDDVLMQVAVTSTPAQWRFPVAPIIKNGEGKMLTDLEAAELLSRGHALEWTGRGWKLLPESGHRRLDVVTKGLQNALPSSQVLQDSDSRQGILQDSDSRISVSDR